MGLTPVPPGWLATIVTSLEMTAPPSAPRAPAKSALKLERWRPPVDLERYRALFRAVGAPWLWVSRLEMDDVALTEIVDAESTEIFAATRRDGTPVGLLELDLAGGDSVELAFFGVLPEMTGRGVGGWLMEHALRRAWRDGIRRVWVHTCDLDHPGALRFYQRQGFKAYARAVEMLPDPRLTGLHPRDAAPHILLIA